MKFKIMLLNVMKYEKDGQVKSRLGYIIPTQEAFSDRDKFKGYSELASYRNDDKYFSLIPKNFIGQMCDITITEKPNSANPMKTYKEFTDITCNGQTVSLV